MRSFLDQYKQTIFGVGIVVGAIGTVGSAYIMWKTDKTEVIFLAASTLMMTSLYLTIAAIDVSYRSAND